MLILFISMSIMFSDIFNKNTPFVHFTSLLYSSVFVCMVIFAFFCVSCVDIAVGFIATLAFDIGAS